MRKLLPREWRSELQAGRQALSPHLTTICVSLMTSHCCFSAPGTQAAEELTPWHAACNVRAQNHLLSKTPVMFLHWLQLLPFPAHLEVTSKGPKWELQHMACRLTEQKPRWPFRSLVSPQ